MISVARPINGRSATPRAPRASSCTLPAHSKQNPRQYSHMAGFYQGTLQHATFVDASVNELDKISVYCCAYEAILVQIKDDFRKWEHADLRKLHELQVNFEKTHCLAATACRCIAVYASIQGRQSQVLSPHPAHVVPVDESLRGGYLERAHELLAVVPGYPVP